METDNKLEWLLVTVGAVPMAVEPHLPTILRRNFGVRLFFLAATVIVIVPAVAIIAIDSVLLTAVVFSATTAVTGFLGYCEMYRALREINSRVTAIGDGQFDIDFGVSRIDEIGETYHGLETVAQSLGETIDEAQSAQADAEQAREKAEQAREQAEREREEMEQLTAHLETKANDYREVLADAADGDLASRVVADSQSEAMAAVGTGINETLAALESAIGRSQTVATEVADESHAVVQQGNEAMSETETVAESIQDIAEDTEQQRDQLVDASGEMSDLSATVEEMASSVTELAAQSDDAAELGRSARASSSDAASALETIEEQVTVATEEIQELREISDQVADIVELIDSIAEETNTLALNASIEAARAGEAGEGFAVVANNVKTLANETQEATDEVDELITSMQEQVEASVQEIDTVQTEVEHGSDTIGETISTLETVVEKIVAVNSGIQEIDTVAEQQAESTQEVVTLIDGVHDIADDTANRTDKIAASSTRQHTAVTEVTEAVQSFETKTSKLQAYLDNFNINNTEGSKPLATVTE